MRHTRIGYQPIMTNQKPDGWFEHLLAIGQALPGGAGFICYRKLKRRFRQRNAHVWQQIIDDLRPGDLCIDLGANVGTITQQMAGTGAHVIAFEPDPDTFAMLETNVGIGSNIELHQKAAGHKAERLLLKRSKRLNEDFERFSEASSLVRDDHTMDAANSVEVEVVDFPNFAASLDRDIRLIKMDIEGAEWDLLEALLKHPILDRIDCIFVETHEWMDAKKYMPQASRLQRRAEEIGRPYINLFWH